MRDDRESRVVSTASVCTGDGSKFGADCPELEACCPSDQGTGAIRLVTTLPVVSAPVSLQELSLLAKLSTSAENFEPLSAPKA